MYIPCEASSWTLLHQNRKLSSRIALQNRLFCLCDYQPCYGIPLFFSFNSNWRRSVEGSWEILYLIKLFYFIYSRGPCWSMSYVVGSNSSYKPITNLTWISAQICKLQTGALDSHPQVIKFTSCLLRVDGSLRVLWLSPPLKTCRHVIAEILLKLTLKPN